MRWRWIVMPFVALVASTASRAQEKPAIVADMDHYIEDPRGAGTYRALAGLGDPDFGRRDASDGESWEQQESDRKLFDLDYAGDCREAYALKTYRERVSRFGDKHFTFWETPDGLTGVLEYNRDLFEAATARQLTDHLRHLLQRLGAEPDTRINEVSLLDAAEFRRLLAFSNGPSHAHATDQSLIAVFERQAAATCLIFEILDDLRVMVRVTGLAHLDLIDRLRRINMHLHEVQQLRPITLGAWRGLEQRRVLIGKDNFSMMFRRGQKRLRPPDSIRMPAQPHCRYPPHGGIPFSEEETHSRPRFGRRRGIFVTRCGCLVADSIDGCGRPEHADASRCVTTERDPRRLTADREGQRCKHRRAPCVEPIWLDGWRSATSSAGPS